MFGIVMVGLGCGLISMFFIILEINESFQRWAYYSKKLTFLTMYKFPYYLVRAWSPLIIDVGLTLGVVTLFSMGGGMLGMVLSLAASALISGFLYFRNLNINKQRT